MQKQIIDFGLPCPPHGPTQVAVPAIGEAPPSQGGLPSDGAASPSQGGLPSDGAVAGSADLGPDAPGEPAEPDDDSADDVEVVKDPERRLSLGNIK